MHVKADRLIRDSAELVTEAVGVAAIFGSGKRVCAGILAILPEEYTIFGVCESYVDVEVASSAYLVSEGHLIAMVKIFKEAFFAVWLEFDHMCGGWGDEGEEEQGSKGPC